MLTGLKSVNHTRGIYMLKVAGTKGCSHDSWHLRENPYVRSRNRPHGRLDRSGLGRVDNGLSDKTENDSCRLSDGGYGKYFVCQ